MTQSTPTLDRLVIGLLAGAAVGAFVVTILSAVAVGGLAFSAWQIAFTALLAFALLALTMPLTQAPLWFLLRALRVSDWLAATIAGGLAFLATLAILVVAWSNYVDPAPTAQTVLLLTSWGAAGLVAGFVTWRVACLEIS